MKTQMIIIPAVGEITAHTLDPQNHAQVKDLIDRADAYFRLAAKTWENGNNSGCPNCLKTSEASCERKRRKAEALLAPLNVKCSYPGLYPSFEVNGYEEMTTEMAVLNALGHPRNWFNQILTA